MSSRPSSAPGLRLLISLVVAAGMPLVPLAQIAGESVNMVSGTQWPGGDPFLQRQNEPSIAVSSANPQNLLAGANDYRTVDIPDPFLPGEQRKMPGDAWQGVFKSYDGGQTWKSTLMPGYPQDTSTDGLGSAAQQRGPDGRARYDAAADSVVRAGTDGMFYFAGIVFKRGTSEGRIVVNRFIDLNDKEGGDPIAGTDPIRWIDAKVIDQGGATYFADKPWIAVDVPRPGALTCSIQRFGRSFQGGAIYVAWARIYGDTAADILISRSLDCGDTWSEPLKLNDQKSQASQGVTVSVDPRTGYVYVAWRRVGIAGASPKQDEDAIFAVRSFSGGRKFTQPRLVTTFVPYEQGQGSLRFRTEAFPTMATSVDASGTRSWTHLAWAQRGANGDGQVVMTHVVVSAPPKTYDEWNDPLDGWKIPADPVDTAPIVDGPQGNAFTRGHQFMPALTFTQGKLVLVYYDSRLDHTRTYHSPHQSEDPCFPVGSCWAPDAEGRWYDEERGPLGERTGLDWRTDELDDGFMTQTRHTVDVRMATATPSANPSFTGATLSRMPFGQRGDELDLYASGQAAGFAGPIEVVDFAASPRPALRRLQDLQVNPPNLPMFKNGTVPFIGDYIDVQGPVFVRTATGWAFDTAPTSAPVFHAVWTSNQDVVPPLDGNWARYTPPARAAGTTSIYDPGQQLASGCEPGFTGTRNQNVYTARISDGLVVTSPQNAKLLDSTRDRTFVVSAFNATGVERRFEFSFAGVQPGVRASFRPATDPVTPTVTVTIPARSSSVQTAFLRLEEGTSPATANPATTVVNVTEVGQGNARLSGSVTLNPPGLTFSLAPVDDGSGSSDAGERLEVQLSAASLYYANLSNANLSNANLSNANLSNANLSNANLSNANLSNANLSNADPSAFTLEAAHLSNANLSNANLSNANLSNTTLSTANLSNANLSNANLSNANLSNAALADIDYTVTNTGNTTQGFDVRLLSTLSGSYAPVQLIVSRPYGKPIANGCELQEQPDNRLLVNAGTVDPVTNPGAQAPLASFAIAPGETIRVTLRTYLTPYQARTLATLVAPVVTPQGNPFASTTALIVTRPQGAETARVGTPYLLDLEASGGTGQLTWGLATGSALPPGFDAGQLAQGRLSGTPTQAGTYVFTLQVVDSATPLPNQMFKDVTLVVEKGATTTSLSTPTPLTFHGEAVSLVATVSPPSAPGPVTFREGAVVLGTATVGTNGVFTLTIPSTGLPPLDVGLHAITATHAELPGWTGSTSGTVSVRVKVDTTLALASIPANPIYGQPVVLVASFQSLPPGAPPPSVQAVFHEGTTPLGSGTFQDGQASSPPFLPGGGSHSYGVEFAGDDDYAPASLTGIVISVGQAPVQDVFVTSSGSPSYFGGPVTFTARVASPAGTPGGGITFVIDGVDSGPIAMEADLVTSEGVARLEISSLPVGPHVVSARYSGSSDFTPATSLVGLGHEVRATTAAAVSSSPNPSRDGEAVTLTCVVSSAGGAPTGTVTFRDGASTLGAATSPVSSTGTSSSWTLGNVALATGGHTLTCAYQGPGSFDPATSATHSHLVGPFATSTTVTASPTAIAYGATVTLTAAVTSAVGIPSGSVTFSATTATGTRTWAAVSLGSGGVATLNDATLEAGAHVVRAEYGGGPLHLPSSGTAAAKLTVQSIYAFTGFLSPLKAAGSYDAPTYSGTQKLGSAIPVKWQLRDASRAFVADLTTLRSLLAYPVPCSPLGPPTASTPLFLYVIPGGATGGSTFRYGSNAYIFNWDTSNGVTPGCFDLVLTLKDGTVKSTVVKLQ